MDQDSPSRSYLLFVCLLFVLKNICIHEKLGGNGCHHHHLCNCVHLTNGYNHRSGIVMEKAANQGQEQQQWAALKCPRCESSNTKFCYYNNYSLSQPRHFCKTCKRYWTRGGTLRNVPAGGGCRKKNKRPSCSGNNKIIDGASSVSAHQPQIMDMNNPLFYGSMPTNQSEIKNLQFPPRFDHLDGVPLFSSGFHDVVSTSNSTFSSYNSNFGPASSPTPTMSSMVLTGSGILKQPHDDQVTSHFQNYLQMQQLWRITNHAGLSDILDFNNAWQMSGGL